MTSKARRAVSEPSSGRASGVATIRDVAARAGVSVATVSRTLNGVGPVTDDTSKRVLAAVRALRYVPHAAARSLSIRRSHTLGVLLPEVHGEFFSEVIRGIDVAARARGYHILVSSSHADAQEMSSVLRALRGRVDGLIVMSPDVELGPLSRALAGDTPVVLLNSATTARATIRIDNYTGAHSMTDHLLSLGHEHIAFITGPERNADAAERRRGYRAALEARTKRLPIEIEGDFTEEAGYRAVPRILASNARPTAIFAANDSMAIGALRALREAAIVVPDGMTLAGFDDIPMARYLTPQLTTVGVDIAEMGRRAVEYLVSSLEESDPAGRKHDVIPVTLVVRESCCAPSARDRAPHKPTLRSRSAVKEESQ
ncbi:MAG TPA: LacI family DNA-binding transcriptional regulator [Thermoanaerobaculia bacterium]|nr:LacI family DNA-binding transcriptional regulator [Thermoanaerobaculia bacterium]